MKLSYSGAGVLPYYIDSDKNLWVYLGLRRFNPEKNNWSLFGGAFEKEKDRDLLDTARRELFEEIEFVAEKEELQEICDLKFLTFEYKVYALHLESKVESSRTVETFENKWFKADSLQDNKTIFLEKEIKDLKKILEK